mmetsp:Transcript_4553/g.14763  ORF Transcript_4553/g.14763 Transcript_4553/m.14763 type:complete len:258 (-) Transcript_4553:11-784(-)
MFDAHRFQIQRHVGDEIGTNRRNRRIFRHSSVISRVTNCENDQLVVLFPRSSFKKSLASRPVVHVDVFVIINTAVGTRDRTLIAIITTSIVTTISITALLSQHALRPFQLFVVCPRRRSILVSDSIEIRQRHASSFLFSKIRHHLPILLLQLEQVRERFRFRAAPFIFRLLSFFLSFFFLFFAFFRWYKQRPVKMDACVRCRWFFFQQISSSSPLQSLRDGSVFGGGTTRETKALAKNNEDSDEEERVHDACAHIWP